MLLKINNIDIFLTFLDCITRNVIPSCKFIISKEKTNVFTINDSRTVRLILTTNSLTVDDSNVEFCFNEIGKLKQSITLIKNINKINKCELSFDNTYLSYDNNVKFKLKVTKEDTIIKYITSDIKTEIKYNFIFDTNSSYIKTLLSSINIVNNSDSKIYFSCKDKLIIAEVDDKTNNICDSIGIPVGILREGVIDKVVCIPIESFKAFNTLPSDKIQVGLANSVMFITEVNTVDNDYFINLKVLSAILKG